MKSFKQTTQMMIDIKRKRAYEGVNLDGFLHLVAVNLSTPEGREWLSTELPSWLRAELSWKHARYLLVFGEDPADPANDQHTVVRDALIPNRDFEELLSRIEGLLTGPAKDSTVVVLPVGLSSQEETLLEARVKAARCAERVTF